MIICLTHNNGGGDFYVNPDHIVRVESWIRNNEVIGSEVYLAGLSCPLIVMEKPGIIQYYIRRESQRCYTTEGSKVK